ncbi:unnamed protein product, partial [Discosporangium mesarthrocarpum]
MAPGPSGGVGGEAGLDRLMRVMVNALDVSVMPPEPLLVFWASCPSQFVAVTSVVDFAAVGRGVPPQLGYTGYDTRRLRVLLHLCPAPLFRNKVLLFCCGGRLSSCTLMWCGHTKTHLTKTKDKTGRQE